MAFVLRKLDRRAGFHPVAWVQDGDVPGDALGNLRTQGNALSVWLVDDKRSNLKRIVAAVAAGRMKLDKLDYALLDSRKVEELGLRMIQEKGESCDADANTLWHQDLQELSGSNLIAFAVMMQAHAEFQRVHRTTVGQWIAASIKNGFIDPSRVDETLKCGLPASM